MKRNYFKLFILVVIIATTIQSFSQTKTYTVTSGELLFQWADIQLTDAALADPNYELVGNPLRFTCFFHLGQYVHMDFTNSIGLFTGLAVRNVGFISDERIDLNPTDGESNLEDFKIIRRSYTLGVPLVFKLGSFKNHTYIFGGGEYELAYAFKEKYWNSHSRSGSKTKSTQWFGAQTPTFIPSAIAGVQFPGGVNIKFKYYLDNFIDNTYSNPNNPISDLTRYETTQVMYISLSWQFNTSKITKEGRQSDDDWFSSL